MQNTYLINGRHDACLTPLDRGFAYGDGVFRTFPVRGGIPECWELHYRKLHEDCSALEIRCPPAELLLADIVQLCQRDEAVAVKIVVTRGEGRRGYTLPAPAQPNRIVVKSHLPEYPSHYFSEGVQLHLCQLRLALQPRLAGIKHLNRLENVLARMEWTDSQFADGLLMDSAGRVIECTASNIFFLENRTLLTPGLSRCGVAGVTRQRVLECAPQLGYSVKMVDVELDRLLRADEVILCNSLIGTWQVRALNGTTWPPGNLATHLRNQLQLQHATVA